MEVWKAIKFRSIHIGEISKRYIGRKTIDAVYFLDFGMAFKKMNSVNIENGYLDLDSVSDYLFLEWVLLELILDLIH